jgi:hypothetical protein
MKIARPYNEQLALCILGRMARISCRSCAEAKLLLDVYGSMRCSDGAGADLEYTIDGTETSNVFRIMRPGRPPLFAHGSAEFIYLLEKDLTIETQHLRPDLYFVHAAALVLDGSAVLLVAPSGDGKSTTAWGLLHHGFRYMSDELAPIDLPKMEVSAYPHALCLKKEPPAKYPLPSSTLRTERTLHVPTSQLPSSLRTEPVRLSTLIFLSYCGNEDAAPEIATISRSEAAARLYTQALNALAHPDDGLRAAEAIACHTACYRLRSGNLRSTCELLTRTLMD